MKPKYQNYRVCYNATREKVYELYKYCRCEDCQQKLKSKRETPNKATAYAKDISKVDEVAEFLKNWTCKNEYEEIPSKIILGITYFYF